MKTLIRWSKFNLVGAMGVAVQLATLAAFNRRAHGHYLCASAAAVEVTLLHNFIWHTLYTWRDRHESSTRLRQFVRFHLSIGMVSMPGNLVLTQLLVHEAHLPLLIANLLAILCCSLINFRLANGWVFASLRNAGGLDSQDHGATLIRPAERPRSVKRPMPRRTELARFTDHLPLPVAVLHGKATVLMANARRRKNNAGAYTLEHGHRHKIGQWNTADGYRSVGLGRSLLEQFRRLRALAELGHLLHP